MTIVQHAGCRPQLLDELDLSVKHVGRAQQEAPQPQQEADHLSVEGPSQPRGLHGLHQRQVAVHTYHDQRVAAGVEVDHNGRVDQFAQGFPVRPVVLVQDIHGPEWEAAQQDKVGQRQVAQVDLRDGQSVLVDQVHQQHEGVKEEPKQA